MTMKQQEKEHNSFMAVMRYADDARARGVAAAEFCAYWTVLGHPGLAMTLALQNVQATTDYRDALALADDLLRTGSADR